MSITGVFVLATLSIVLGILIGSAFVIYLIKRSGVFKGDAGKPGSIGPIGMMGAPASIIRLRGTRDSVDDLPNVANHADCYIVDGRFFVFIKDDDNDRLGTYKNAGSITVSC